MAKSVNQNNLPVMRFNALWRRVTEWALNRFTHPPSRGKWAAVAAIGGLVLMIGVVDFATGIYISVGVFYLIPVALAVVWLGWQGGVITAFISIAVRLVSDLLVMHGRPLPFWSCWNLSAATVTYLIMVWILHALMALHRQLERRVEERTLALREAAAAHQRLVNELAEMSLRERNAIGRELHDDLCQHLVGTALAAQVLTQRLAGKDAAATEDARAIVAWIGEGIAKTRQLARGLLLLSIEPEQLPGELAELAASSSTAGVSCRFRQDGKWLAENGTVSVQLFRVAQEAVRNALRHAGARHVNLTLAGDDHAVCLVVEDDGRGMPPVSERGAGMGLRVMEQRAMSVGGSLSVVTAPGEGTRIICYLPRNPAVFSVQS